MGEGTLRPSDLNEDVGADLWLMQFSLDGEGLSWHLFLATTSIPAKAAAGVCVCVFVPSIIGGSPSVQGETCATLCSVSRGLHLFSG